MGYGSWSNQAYTDYSTSVGRNTTSINGISYMTDNYSAQELYRSRQLDSALDPNNVVRECCDSDEHPNTIPVILALDVTGSMGGASVEVAKKLNEIMTTLYEEIADVQFMIMGIGDLYCDNAPIQASQFESDIRIAEQLDKIYFEGGGGGNGYESYTAAWYFGLYHTKLDCWNRGKKGIIITFGDEPLNPYLPKRRLETVTGDNLEGDINTDFLYNQVVEKFNVYHLAVNDRETCYNIYEDRIKSSFGKYLKDDHFKVVTMDNLAKTITDIIIENENGKDNETHVESTEISW